MHATQQPPQHSASAQQQTPAGYTLYAKEDPGHGQIPGAGKTTRRQRRRAAAAAAGGTVAADQSVNRSYSYGSKGSGKGTRKHAGTSEREQPPPPSAQGKGQSTTGPRPKPWWRKEPCAEQGPVSLSLLALMVSPLLLMPARQAGGELRPQVPALPCPARTPLATPRPGHTARRSGYARGVQPATS